MAHLLIYGGTFDPVHHGHLITCRAAREALGADRVVLIPAFLSPHKKEGPPAASPGQRLCMVEMAIAGYNDFAADAREIHRGQSTGVSYTFDTVADIQRMRPADRLTLLIGEDQLPKFHLWHRIDDLLALVPVAVMTRGSRSGADLALTRQHLGAAADRIQLLPTPRIDISATDIRARVAAGLPISHLVPPAVANFIHAEKLYR